MNTIIQALWIQAQANITFEDYHRKTGYNHFGQLETLEILAAKT